VQSKKDAHVLVTTSISRFSNTFVEGFDANILSTSGALVETFRMGEFTVVFVCGPLSVRNTLLVETCSSRSVDCGDSTAVAFFETLFEFTLKY